MEPVVRDPDHLLATTRSVRRRLDLTRPVPLDLVDECVALAQQAPTGGNRPAGAFVVVSDPELRRELAALYRRGWERYLAAGVGSGAPSRPSDDPAAQRRVATSARYLMEHLAEVPVHVIPCVRPRTVGGTLVEQASAFGSILPAAWSYMLAARARGLGTAWTTIHLFHEEEAAALLGIPDEYMQVALIPTAFTTGGDFKPAARPPLERFRHHDRWTSATPRRDG